MFAEVRPARRVGRFAWTWLELAAQRPLAAAGLIYLAVLLGLALFPHLVAPYPPLEMKPEARFSPPGAYHLFGTDNFGRDVFSRMVWGARPAVLIGFSAVLVGSTVGALLGLVSGYFGGWADSLVQRAVDILMVFPTLLLAMVLVAIAGPSTSTLVLAVAATLVAPAARAVRSLALSVRNSTYIEAARVIGCPEHLIILRHLLPNCLAPYLVIATASLGNAIVVEASLSFLGLGVQPPDPSWGNMLSREGRGFFYRAPWLAVFPGISIALTVLAFNFVGDSIRDYIDPRLRRNRGSGGEG